GGGQEPALYFGSDTTLGNTGDGNTLHVGSPSGGGLCSREGGEIVLPRAGHLKNFYGCAQSGLGSGPTFTVYVNGSASALTVAFTGLELALADDTHTVAVNRGDRVAVLSTSGGIYPTDKVWACIKYAL